MTAYEIVALGPEHTEAFHALRREGLQDTPAAFGSSPEDDRARELPECRRILSGETGSTVFGALLPGGALIGIVGLARPTQVKARHHAMIWGMFVSSRHRRLGAGRALMQAAITRAREGGAACVQLAVSDKTVAARRLYESLGFVIWGREPMALFVDGEFVDEHHMALDLR